MVTDVHTIFSPVYGNMIWFLLLHFNQPAAIKRMKKTVYQPHLPLHRRISWKKRSSSCDTLEHNNTKTPEINLRYNYYNYSIYCTPFLRPCYSFGSAGSLVQRTASFQQMMYTYYSDHIVWHSQNLSTCKPPIYRSNIVEHRICLLCCM